VSSQLSTVEPHNSSAEEIKSAYDDALSHIYEANTVMAQLRGGMPINEVSDVIEEIVRSAPKGIVFSTFQAAREGQQLKTVDVQGEAATRNALASLKTALEASPLFETANVPISDLARENNLPFVVTITLSEKSSTE
jgi:Tfp pilus assembly protein PilN